jgi:hypothetical protein
MFEKKFSFFDSPANRKPVFALKHALCRNSGYIREGILHRFRIAGSVECSGLKVHAGRRYREVPCVKGRLNQFNEHGFHAGKMFKKIQAIS